MPTGARARLRIAEYGPSIDLGAQVATAAGVSGGVARQLIHAVGERAAAALRLGANPFSVTPAGVRVADIAGIVRLAPSVELEIAPKFLGATEQGWREDFYFLANLSRHGRLFAAERLRAAGGTPRDLSTLVARSLCGMYADNRRRPLRTYRKSLEEDFYCDGEIDPYDIRFPSAGGFPQEVIRYDRRNVFNASIRAAAEQLLPEVSDPSALAELVRLTEDLPPQARATPQRTRRLPSRSQRWQPIVELANDVLKGLGASLKVGKYSAPGYLMSTWQTWETLLLIAARLAFGRAAVASQKPHQLGQRVRAGGPAARLNVYPDLVISAVPGRPAFLLDAKYKASVERGRVRVVEADIYEALAFARASGLNDIVLAYPALPSAAPRVLGECELVERVEVDAIRVYGVQVEVRGIGQRRGLVRFAERMKQDVANCVAAGGANVPH